MEIRGVFRAGPVDEAAVESGPRTALLCLEANPAGCHRRLVAELPGACRRVVDL